MNLAAHALALAQAWEDYQAKLAALGAIVQCRSHWPSDPPGVNYPGTGCDLLEGHTDEHRAKVPGSTVVVTW